MSYVFTDEMELYFRYSPRKLSWEEHRKEFAERLKGLMSDRYWNINDLAGELGVSAKTAGQWLRPQDYGEKRFPKYEHLQRIADLFDVSIAWLVGEIDADGCPAQYVANYLGLDPAAVDMIRAITAVQGNGSHHPYQSRWRELSALLICLDPDIIAPLNTLIEAAWHIEHFGDPLEAIAARGTADAKARQARFELVSNIDAMIRERFAVPKDESFMTPTGQECMNKLRELKEKQEERFDPTPLIEEYQQAVKTQHMAFERARKRIIESLTDSED